MALTPYRIIFISCYHIPKYSAHLCYYALGTFGMQGNPVNNSSPENMYDHIAFTQISHSCIQEKTTQQPSHIKVNFS